MVRAPVFDRVLVVASPAILLALGSYGVARGGTSSPGMVLLVVGVAILVGGALSVPLSSTLDADGVAVRTLVRRRKISWDDVVAFERHKGRAKGALVVRTVEPKRVALSTSVERFDTYHHLRDLVLVHGPSIALPPAPPVERSERPL